MHTCGNGAHAGVLLAAVVVGASVEVAVARRCAEDEIAVGTETYGAKTQVLPGAIAKGADKFRLAAGIHGLRAHPARRSAGQCERAAGRNGCIGAARPRAGQPARAVERGAVKIIHKRGRKAQRTAVETAHDDAGAYATCFKVAIGRLREATRRCRGGRCGRCRGARRACGCGDRCIGGRACGRVDGCAGRRVGGCARGRGRGRGCGAAIGGRDRMVAGCYRDKRLIAPRDGEVGKGNRRAVNQHTAQRCAVGCGGQQETQRGGAAARAKGEA